MHAQVHESDWLTNSLNQACPLLSQQGQIGPFPGQGFQTPEQVACFDPNGSLLSNQNTTRLPSAFLINTLVQTALQTGQPASDIVDAGGATGHIYRYALLVPNQTGSGNLGVLLIGEPVQAQESALSLLLTLLLTIRRAPLFGTHPPGPSRSHPAPDP